MVIAERHTRSPKREIVIKSPKYREFEGVRIQWDKVPWNFRHPELGGVTVDTYSIWNPSHHEEIATRLALGQRCAINMMGTYGVAEVREERTQRESDPIFDKIKQRDKMQSLVVFAHPDDIGDFIDFERMPQNLRHLQNLEQRRALYKGPMHAIFPIIPERLPDLGMIRDDRDAAFFWIPGHFGYEELAKKVKGRIGSGVLAGGSLNIHGQSPSYSPEELRAEMARHQEWLKGVHFVINDEFANGIARSHTQVSFMQDPPSVVRKGSLSLEKIARDTGLSLVYDESVKEASSKTPYNQESNQDTDRRVEEALARIARFQASLVA
nr:hypothetical protein [Candidatus Levybacteria bacterium]